MMQAGRLAQPQHSRWTACTQPSSLYTCNHSVKQSVLAPGHHSAADHAQRILRVSVVAHARADEEEDEEDVTTPGKPMRVERLLANLGYGKRRECQILVKQGIATRADGSRLKVGEKVVYSDVLVDGEELDPPPPMAVLLHKPVGYVVTSPDDERIPDPKIYDLLPPRFSIRRPFLSAVGRLDKETSGLLILTDDGQLVHRINSPKKGIWKIYEATLARPLVGTDAEAVARTFAAGTLMLEGEYTPLLPAKLDMQGPTAARLAICEGRYHQVRRMFAAVGNEVVALHRPKVGGFTLDLPRGEWRFLAPAELEQVFAGPSAEDVLGAGAKLIEENAKADKQSVRSPTGGASSSAALVQASEAGDEEGDEEADKDEDEDEAQKKQSGLSRELRARARPKQIRDAARWAQRRAALKKSMSASA